jgi:YVTN family beta-propeller protein
MRSQWTVKILRSIAAAFLLCATSILVAPDIRAKEPPQKPTSLVIITNWGSDTVSLIDIQAGKELGQIPVGLKPYDVQVEQKGRFAYVTASGSDFVSVVDIQAMLERKDERIKVGESPRDLDLTKDGRRAVVANAGSDTISVIDLTAKKQLYTVPVGSIPYGIALTNNDNWVVVTCWGNNKAVLVELGRDSGKVLKTFDVGFLPYTVVIPRQSDMALVTCFGSHQIFPIDLKKQEVGRPVAVGRSPWGLSASPDGKRAIVANFYSADASVLSISGRVTDPLGASAPIQETARISLRHTDPVGAGAATESRPKNAAFSADSNVAILTNLGNNEVMILDIAGKRISRTVPVGKAPYGVAFVPRN